MNYFDQRCLDVSFLKKNHQMIHYFGLGFIQLKLDQYRRMHFYTLFLPPIVPEEDVHNHRYDFTSQILKGTLDQELFVVTDGKDYIKEQESCKEGVQAGSSGNLCNIELASRHKYAAGSEYFISNEVFHRVRSFHCITLITRTDYKKELAEVIRPVGAGKVCPFSQKVEEEKLWEIIEKML